MNTVGATVLSGLCAWQDFFWLDQYLLTRTIHFILISFFFLTLKLKKPSFWAVCRRQSGHGMFACQEGILIIILRNINLKSQPSRSYSFRDHRPPFGQTDMARSTLLMMLIKKIYTFGVGDASLSVP